MHLETCKGMLRWLVLLFGLSTTPTTLIHMMNVVLIPYLDFFVIVYLDDILVFNKVYDEHLH